MFLTEDHETAVDAYFAGLGKIAEWAYLADNDKTADRAKIAVLHGMNACAFLADISGMAKGDELAEDLYLADTPYSADKGFEAVGAFWAVAAYADMQFGPDTKGFIGMSKHAVNEVQRTEQIPYEDFPVFLLKQKLDFSLV